MSVHGPRAAVLEAREVPLGGVRDERAARAAQQGRADDRRLVLPRPVRPAEVRMRVEPHPHIGLQTVTWPLVGEIRHRDTIDSDVVRRGQLNLMTAGRASRTPSTRWARRPARSTRCSSGWCCPTAPPPARPASSSTCRCRV
jgi:hypothetical protein